MASSKLRMRNFFSNHKLASFNLAYAFALVWNKAYVFALWDVYGLWVTLVFVLLVPVLLLVAIKLKKGGSKEVNSSPSIFSPKQLSDSQIYLIKQHTPTAQIELVNEVFLVSLGLLHGLLSSIKIEGQAVSLFESKFQLIIEFLKKISQSPEFTNSTMSERSRNNAVITFAYYRLLYKDILPLAIAQGIVSEDTDPWVLIKRIPVRMNIYLGAQFWRTFELKNILFDNLECLKLNEDIKQSLKNLCDENEAAHEVESPKKEEPQSNTTVTELIPSEKQDKPIQAETEQLAPEQNKSIANQIEEHIEEVIKEGLVRISDAPAEIKPSILSKLEKWLPRQIKRYPINISEKFYYDKDYAGVLFIEESFLSDFLLKANATLKDIQEELNPIGEMVEGVFTFQSNSNISLYGFKECLDVSADVISLDDKIELRSEQ